jgi:hypothetical protein
MYIGYSKISCGINELYNIGNHPTDYEYKEIMIDNYNCAILIASLTTKQNNAIKFLKKKGFKAVNKPIRNPNSKNKIILFSKTLSKKERKYWANKYKAKNELL